MDRCLEHAMSRVWRSLVSNPIATCASCCRPSHDDELLPLRDVPRIIQRPFSPLAMFQYFFQLLAIPSCDEETNEEHEGLLAHPGEHKPEPFHCCIYLLARLRITCPTLYFIVTPIYSYVEAFGARNMVIPMEFVHQKESILEKVWSSVQAIIHQRASKVVYNYTRGILKKAREKCERLVASLRFLDDE